MASRIEEKSLQNAFAKQTRWYKPYLLAGINTQKIEERLQSLITSSKNFIQKLNDQYIALRKASTIQEPQEPNT